MFLVRGFFRVIWKSIFAINFIVGLIILYPFFLILLSRRKWFKHAFRLKRFWAYWISYVPGIIPKVISEVELKSINGPVVFCGNHISYIDIVMSYVAIPKYFVFLGKQELNKAPLFRIFFRSQMNVLVDRNKRVAAHRSFLECKKRIHRGESVFLFPEGTISEAGSLKSFKNGAFKLALDTGAPIVPVLFYKNEKRLQTGSFFRSNGSPGRVQVRVLKPVDTQGLSENELVNLRQKVFDLMTDNLRKYGN